MWARELYQFPEEKPGYEPLPKFAADASQSPQQWRLPGAGKTSALHQQQERQPTLTDLCASAMPHQQTICSTQSAMGQCSPQGGNARLLMFWHHACLPGVGEPFTLRETRWWQIVTALLHAWCQEVNVQQWDYNCELIQVKNCMISGLEMYKWTKLLLFCM